MRKRIMAAILCLAMLCSVPVYAAEFTDIKDEETRIAAEVLRSMGIVSGTGSGFHAEGTLTRAQACTMIINMMGLSSQVSGYTKKTVFSDVLPGAWYTGFVNLAYSKGIINGYGNGRFGPEDTVTYGQLATMILRMLGYQTSDIGSIWPGDYTDMCEDLGISDGLGLAPKKAINRGSTAVMLYHSLTASTKTGQDYYRTISGIASTKEAFVMDVDAEDGEVSGKLKVYGLDGSGVGYYAQQNALSSVFEGMQGLVLLGTTGKVCGFIPESSEYVDITLEKADASYVTATSGSKYRLLSSVTIVAGEETYGVSGNGSVKLNSQAGRSARLFLNDDGDVTYVIVAVGGSSSVDVAVAQTNPALNSITRSLGISGKIANITKNGAESASDKLAIYDVAYYDVGTSTLKVCDYRVGGYISAADPGFSNAETITVGGRSFEVLECALEELAKYTLGSEVVLLLTDDLKVASVRPADFACEMVGVLSTDGRSVTLCGSGIILKADTSEYDDSSLGNLVTVSFIDISTMKCKSVGSVSASDPLDIETRTVGSLALSYDCSIYECAAAGGFLYSLEGVQGAASSDFEAITWTDRIPRGSICYYHLNNAGEIDILVLKDVTGNCYDYGKLTRYTDREGINLGSGTMAAYNEAVTVTGAKGSTQKAICTASTLDEYYGISLGGTRKGNLMVKGIATLTKFTQPDKAKFSYCDDEWYVICGDDELAIADDVQIYYAAVNKWISGSDSISTLLTDSYTLTLYYNRSANTGGKVRIIVAE